MTKNSTDFLTAPCSPKIFLKNMSVPAVPPR